VRIVRPVFYEEELIALTLVAGHWADVGGSTPGSFDITAREHYGEGMRIPPVKIVEKGRLNMPLLRMLTANMRVSWEREGDLRAQLAASQAGADYLLRLCKKYGKATILQAFRENMDYVERVARQEFAKCPRGVYEADDYIDEDPAKGEGLVRIHVTLRVQGERIAYDLTGSDPVIDCFLNSTYSSSFSAVIAGTKTMFPAVPLNSGLYRVVGVKLPPNSCVNAPEPAAVTGFCSGAYEKIMSAVFQCWSQLKPERAMACAFNLEYLLIGGHDQRPGFAQAPYIYYDWMSGGWGGRNGRDGPDPLMPVFGLGLQNQPIEATERVTPVLLERLDILSDSSGPGKWRGGPGIQRAARVYASNKTVVSYACDRSRFAPYGIRGGLMGVPHGLVLNPDSVRPAFLGVAFSNVTLQNGDVVWRPSAGGGGFGDPLEREPQMVLADVIDGYVTVERARKDYGVVIRARDRGRLHYGVDTSATRRERATIRRSRRRWLRTDPAHVRKWLLAGEIDLLDALRRYGVVLDRRSQGLPVLPKTTAQLRSFLARTCVPYWT
jgi:N-methylhydantoinase B